MREKWLHKWPKINSTTILMGTGIYCIGCGKDRGVISAMIDPDNIPSKRPEWPFEEKNCPICELEDKVMGGPEDKLTARLVALREKNV